MTDPNAPIETQTPAPEPTPASAPAPAAPAEPVNDGFKSAQDALQSVFATLDEMGIKEQTLAAARARKGDYSVNRPAQPPAQPDPYNQSVQGKTLMEMTEAEAELFLQRKLVDPIVTRYERGSAAESAARDTAVVNQKVFEAGRAAGFSQEEVQGVINQVTRSYGFDYDTPGHAIAAGRIITQQLENMWLKKRIATPASLIPTSAPANAPANPGAVPSGGPTPAAPAVSERAKAESESIERMKSAGSSNTARILGQA